jgi:hypothetical protein
VPVPQPTQVTSCCNFLVSIHQLPFNSQSARMYFWQKHWMFTVEHYMASCSYLTCQNELRDTFPNSPVPNKLAICCFVNHFWLLQKLFTSLHHRWGKVWMHTSLNVRDIASTKYNIAFFWLQCTLFFDKQNMCQKWAAWVFDHSIECICKVSLISKILDLLQSRFSL